MTLQGARALTGLDMDKLAADFAQAGTQFRLVQEAARVLEPWQALHDGRPEEAVRLAEALGDPGASTLVRAAAGSGSAPVVRPRLTGSGLG